MVPWRDQEARDHQLPNVQAGTGGLFCAKIFGPTKDYECNCGKYKRMKHRGVICEKCGVEVIQSKVRRERMGHIELATPVAHIWFLKSLPSKLGNLLDLTLKSMEKVLYFDSAISSSTPRTPRWPRAAADRREIPRSRGGVTAGKFEAGIGAEAVKDCWKRSTWMFFTMSCGKRSGRQSSVAKRQKLGQAASHRRRFPSQRAGSGTWMIMDVIPVLPPDLRPLVPLEGGRFATSDLNDLYRRVINRNNRLKRLMDLKAPISSCATRNACCRNRWTFYSTTAARAGDHRYQQTPAQIPERHAEGQAGPLPPEPSGQARGLLRPYRDHRRSEPALAPVRTSQKDGLELFKPFVYYRLEQKGWSPRSKAPRRWSSARSPRYGTPLDEVVKEYPVMLNRAPTLHRLGIQAFEPT
jgi:DNA-directed RNA polymerase subunit beta'